MGTEPLTDCSILSDCDGDGYDDATDAFDADPEAWDDLDGDGLADTFPNLLVHIRATTDATSRTADAMSWTSIESQSHLVMTLPDEGEDLLFTIDTDSADGDTRLRWYVTDPDGVSTGHLQRVCQQLNSDSDNRLQPLLATGTLSSRTPTETEGHQ